MRTPGNKTGFTIIEVMVFLAISGFTFLIAATFISGKQAQAEYTQGMNNANAFVKTLINNVEIGNYPLPARENLSCTLSGGRPSIGISSFSPSPLGSAGCAIIGLVLAPQTGSDTTKYTIYTVAGCQYDGCSSNGNNPPASFSQEYPISINPMTQSNIWPGALRVISLKVAGPSARTTGAVGIFGSLPQQSLGILQAGAQQARVVLFPGLSPQSFKSTDINSGSVSSLPSGDYVILCLQGPNGENGSISIGGANNGGQLTTTEGMGQETASQC